MCIGTYAVPYMYLQTPQGPGSGPTPPKGTWEWPPTPKHIYLNIDPNSQIVSETHLFSKGHVEKLKMFRDKKHKWGLGLPII